MWTISPDWPSEQGKDRQNVTINAIGPETFTYRGLVATIGSLIGEVRPIISMPPWFGYLTGWLLGLLVGDVVITKEEIEGLMADLLYVDSPPTGDTVLSDWVKEHADTLGRRYTSEFAHGAIDRRPIGRIDARRRPPILWPAQKEPRRGHV